jgi:hypothetical protein
MTEKSEMTSSKHIAGIVPVSKVNTDINLVLHPSMLPLQNDFYAIQRSIAECSYMGCKTIWVVCDESVAPLIKKVCGDFVLSLTQHERAKFANFSSELKRHVPIFYVPLSYKHMNKKGIGVSVMDGVYASYTISDKISKWIAPYRYYVSNPYGVYYPKNVELRQLVKDNESVFMTHKGQGVLQGENLGFSFSVRQFKHCSYLFKRMDVKSDYTLDKVFGDAIMNENSETYEVDYYHNISTWNGYQQYMSDPIRMNNDWRYCFQNAFKKDERKLD